MIYVNTDFLIILSDARRIKETTQKNIRGKWISNESFLRLIAAYVVETYSNSSAALTNKIDTTILIR